MIRQSREFLASRTILERKILLALAWCLAIGLYCWLVLSGTQARKPLQDDVLRLREQAARLEQQAADYLQLQSQPAITASGGDMLTLVQQQVASAGLAPALLRIEPQGDDQVVVQLGALAFVQWVQWLADLETQKIRVTSCQLQALATPGQVSVTATLARPAS